MGQLKLTFLIMLLLVISPRGWGLQFEGVSPEQRQELFKSIPHLDSKSVDLPTLDEAVRLLMLKGNFESVTLDRVGNEYKLVAAATRLIGDIRIEGNAKISDAVIKDVLRLKEGDRFDRKKMSKASEDLRELYRQAGYFNAQIEVSSPVTDDHRVNLHFKINENEPCKLDTLLFESQNKNLNERLAQRNRRYIGRPLTRDLMNKIETRTNEYFADKQMYRSLISEPQISYNENRTKAQLSYRVSDPYSYQIFLEGYKFFSESDLYRLIRNHDYVQGQFEPRSELALIIKNHYLTNGFPNPVVRGEMEEFESSFVRRIKLNINEGARVKIKSYEIGGRISQPSSYYIDFIEKNSDSLIRRGYYNREFLEEGYKNLITHLRNQGYLRARIQASRLEYLDRPQEAKIVLTIDEGPLSKISRIQFEGNKAYTEPELLQILGMSSNSPLRLDQLEKSIETLKTHYKNNGYIEMTILNEGENLLAFNERGTLAEVKFQIREGPQIRVKAIALEGNDFTKDQVILNELDLEDGEILTPEKLEEGMIRLNRLGIFSRVSVRMVEENTPIADRTILVSVTERDPGLLRVGAGLNSERGLTARGFVGLSYNNLWGTARSITSRVELQSNIADVNYLEHKISAGYLEPFLFGTRTRGRVNVTRADEVFDTTKNDNGEIVQLISSDRVDFLLERDLTTHHKLLWTLWSLDTRKRSERHGKCVNDADGYLCPSKTQQISTIGPILDIDYRDNSFLPTRGTYTRLSAEYSHPALGSSELIEFIRSESTFNFYTPITSPRLVWANSISGGYVSNLNRKPGSGVPLRHAFFLGGSSTLRGYESNSRSDRVPNNDEFPADDPIGLVVPKDSHYGLFKTEMRWTFYKDYGFVLFYDGGFVKVTGFDFEKPFRQSVGFGFRVNTPVGPLRLDLGFKLDRRPSEREYRGHFAIGTF